RRRAAEPTNHVVGLTAAKEPAQYATPPLDLVHDRRAAQERERRADTPRPQEAADQREQARQYERKMRSVRRFDVEPRIRTCVDQLAGDPARRFEFAFGGGRALDRRQGANPSVDLVASGPHQPSWGGM